jgi:hypothetical protein
MTLSDGIIAEGEREGMGREVPRPGHYPAADENTSTIATPSRSEDAAGIADSAQKDWPGKRKNPRPFHERGLLI